MIRSPQLADHGDRAVQTQDGQTQSPALDAPEMQFRTQLAPAANSNQSPRSSKQAFVAGDCPLRHSVATVPRRACPSSAQRGKPRRAQRRAQSSDSLPPRERRNTAGVARENVEVIRRLFEAVARRDTEAVLSLYDPEVEWDTSRSPFGDLMGGRLYYGHDGLRSWSRQWYEAWENVVHHCDELIEVGEQVVSSVTNRGLGRASGVEVETHQAAVWTIRSGKIIRAVWFPTRAEALEAAGRGNEPR